MTLEQRIIRDLQAGQATIANLAENVKASTTSIGATLRRLESEGKIWTMENFKGQTVYKLTYHLKQNK
jgi:DNA-binding Lrp family transcriptional regulator